MQIVMFVLSKLCTYLNDKQIIVLVSYCSLLYLLQILLKMFYINYRKIDEYQKSVLGYYQMRIELCILLLKITDLR